MASARKDPTAESARRDRTRRLSIQEVRFNDNDSIAQIAEALRRFQNAVWVNIRRLNERFIQRSVHVEVVLQLGTNAVAHGLGVLPTGWRITRVLDGDPSLYVTTENWELRSVAEVVMENGADNVTYTLEFFG